MSTALASTGRFWDVLSIADATRTAGQRLLRLQHHRYQRPCFRALPLVYLVAPPSGIVEPLFYAASAEGRRWTPIGGPRGLYLSEDPATPPTELRMMALDTMGTVIDVVANQHIVTLAIEASFARVLDMTSPATQDALELTMTDLHADWEAEQQAALVNASRPPITQLLASAAHATGVISAIRYQSARTPFGVNVVAFPDRLDAARGEYIRTTDKHDLYPQCIPPTIVPPMDAGLVARRLAASPTITA